MLRKGKNKLGSIIDKNVVFISNNFERMRLTNTGNFGINTSSPTTYLDVNGQIRLRYNAINHGVLTSDANGNATWSLLNLDLSNNILSILNQGSTVDLSDYSQNLNIVGTELSISNGNSVNFAGWDTDASDDFSGDYLDLINKPILFDGNYYSLSNLPTLFDGSYNSLSDLPVLFNGDYNSLINLPTLFEGNWSSLEGTPPAISYFENDANYITNPDDADADPTNELQNLSINGNMLDISLGNSVSLDGLNYWSKLNNNLYYKSGKVGIGISAPNKLLHLHSESTYNLDEAISVLNSEISLGSLKAASIRPTIRTGSEATLLLTNKFAGSEATDGLLIRSYNNNAEIILQEEGNFSIITKKDLRFKMQQNGNVSIGKATKNYFTVNKNGNVGIGTDEPGTSLEVHDGTLRISGGSSFGQDNARFVIDPGDSNAHRLIELRNDQQGKIMVVNGNGKVGIGINNPREKLSVKGKILSEENIVVLNAETSNYPDYVFEDTYHLISLYDLSDYIRKHKHLPEIPTAENVKKNGMKLGEMNISLLKKIEELTLYIIEQQKIIDELKTRIEKLEEEE